MEKVVILFYLLLASICLVLMVLNLLSLVIGGVPFVPTPRKVVSKMMELAEIKKGEKVYDLGCGDGRLLIEARKKYGAVGVGIEISPILCWLARARMWISGMDCVILRANILKCDFTDADVIFCYLYPGLLKKLEKDLKKLKKGARIISHDFEIPGWMPSASSQVEERTFIAKVLKYQV